MSSCDFLPNLRVDVYIIIHLKHFRLLSDESLVSLYKGMSECFLINWSQMPCFLITSPADRITMKERLSRDPTADINFFLL